ncbi:Putative tyrosine-protein phosphatase 1 [Papilio machaon]|uniref:Putative tyrosine-protein phosphatase 1 n=1 Tax=Papilio machaon TaxID=76193 RepID=A0A194QMK9_PAPMA|nr:Putative tyrosine-protein phosphatase 1 [Papilio machaon]
MAGRIPDRWLQYKACGKVIEGTRIICFKVPLKRECPGEQLVLNKMAQRFSKYDVSVVENILFKDESMKALVRRSAALQEICPARVDPDGGGVVRPYSR